MKSIILIPAYQPTSELSNLVNELCQLPEQEIIIVNDGSTQECIPLFEALSQKHKQVTILHHAVNLGKGQALKTGMNYFLVSYPEDYLGLITTDADGQHAYNDIKKLIIALKDDPSSLHLGVRTLDKNVPFRSSFGNRLTSFIFKLLTKVNLIDTQTGLRGIPRGFLLDLLHSSEMGYDFELDMLMRAAKKHVNIKQIPIETIYLNENKNSHFNILRDSFKIYYVFFRFLSSSLATTVIDFTVFSIGYFFTQNILTSIIISRIFAGFFQFFASKYLVFKSKGAFGVEILKYVALVALLMGLSYSLIEPLVNQLSVNPYIAKVIAESIIFLLSFTAQNLYVYSSPNSDSANDKTDWDVYYKTPFKAASISRKFTKKRIEDNISLFSTEEPKHIVELGGGNSSFFLGLRALFPHTKYTVIDNNAYGLNLFKQVNSEDGKISIICHDVIDNQHALNLSADIVFSVGLIEHFSPTGTSQAIKKHFSLTKQSGIVIITFPTPTWLYQLARRITEFFGMWRFPDERPLGFEEVLSEVKKHGEILHTSINWPIIFTQGIVVARKY